MCGERTLVSGSFPPLDFAGPTVARGGDLPFEFVEKVLAECSAYQPVVDFIGGEPLLYSQLSNAVKLASQRNVLSVVTTNGLKLKDKAEEFVRAKLQFSRSH
jgi:MoaA/NifB/PqqE/SkfB family radical SAM enzyme